MDVSIREWNIENADALCQLLNNKNILDNLRDGLPHPYTKKDAEEFITAMLAADKTKTFAYNKASCRVLEKAGFQFEGALRNNAVKNGSVLDMRMYSLVRQPE